MKSRFNSVFGFGLVLFLISTNLPALDSRMARFAAEKEAQARELAESQTNDVPSFVWSFFNAVKVDDWETATNLAGRIQEEGGGDYRVNAVTPLLWQPIHETLGAYGEFHDWDNELLHRFGSNIIDSIPKRSIYFGGTDPGRFLITALSESHREGKPFLTLTQNRLVDAGYLAYLRKMYGRKIYVPTTNDNRQAFNEYLQDARKRLKNGKLKPGEDVRIVRGRVQVSGQIAVMHINGLLAKLILEKNPDRRVFIEESFPLDWMYPNLSPHGLIMELHHEPVAVLREETLRKEQQFWSRFTAELIGDWMTGETSIGDLCEFGEKVYLQKDLDGFKGDRAFARSETAQKCFSKLRSSIAGLYAWRAEHSDGEDERIRMRKAADLAFRQAFVLCPCSPEAVFRYCNFLMQRNRREDAIRVVQTARRMNPDEAGFRGLLRALER